MVDVDANDILKNLNKGFKAPVDEFDRLFGTKEVNLALPEVQGREFEKAFGTLASGKLFLASSPQQTVDIIQAERPDASFELDKGGNIVVTLPDPGGEKSFFLNKPGLSTRDISDFARDVLAFLPAGRAATIPAALTARVAAGGAAGAATSAGLDVAAEQAGAEQGVDPTRALVSGAAEAGGPLIARGLRSLVRGRGAPVESLQALSEQAKTAGGQAEKTLIDAGLLDKELLFPAQRTGDPALLQLQSFLPQLPSVSTKAMAALKQQNRQVANLTENILERIVPETSALDLQQRIKTVARQLIDTKRALRTQKTSSLFKEAFSDANTALERVDVSASLDLGENILSQRFGPETKTGSAVAALLKRIKRASAANLETLPVPKGAPKGTKAEIVPVGSNLERLHGVKTELQEEIAEAAAKGQNARVFALGEIERSLRESLKETSPQYKNALQEFIDQTPAIEALEESLIGSVSRLSNAEKTSASNLIFQPGNNPKIIRATREAITGVNPGIWNEIVGAEIDKRIGGAFERVAKDIAEGNLVNVPARLNASLFGNPRARRALLEGAEPGVRKSLLDLERILEKAARGRVVGSPTAIRTRLLDSLKGAFFQLRQAVKPLEFVAKAGEEASVERGAAKLGENLFDPEGFKDVVIRLGKLNPLNPEFERLLINRLGIISPATARALTEEEEIGVRP